MDPHGWLMLFVLVALGGGGYYLSLVFHPDRDCPRCKGAGKRYGSVWTSARRQCTYCRGTPGRRPRLGTKVRRWWAGRQ